MRTTVTFFKIANGIKLTDGIDKILAVTKGNLNRKNLTYDDDIAQAYLCFRLFGVKEYATIKQVIIDEGQDYYPFHYEIFKMTGK